MSETGSETPIQEAISIVTIGAILPAVGCYAAAVSNVPIVSAVLFWVAARVYSVFPWLNGFRSAQMPMLVAAATVGCSLWIVGLRARRLWLAG